ncbi:MAG: TonB-dependent receptor [Burkholderiaceae bacterium]
MMVSSAAAAQSPSDDADAAAKADDDRRSALPAVRVEAPREPALVLPPTESTTVIEAAQIERKQAVTIFDVVKDTPGVSVDGGPRASGMKFNIRGFRGNEDVLFKIDGAVKGFEKYRFGSGVFIEPELIRSITIERGPSVLTGAGAIGGAVIATTKTAADFLRPGERVGGLLKAGYTDNNRERLRMLTAFARPTQRSDLLVSVVRRDSTDIKLADGSRLAATANQTEGSLLKFGWFPTDRLSFELSRTAFQSGPTYTPFDANSSNAFVGGYVHQKIDDETINLRVNYDPGSPWIKLRGTIAHEATKLNNLMLTGAGESTFTVPCATTPCVWSPYGGATGSMHDYWNYDIWSAELFNESRYAWGSVDGVLTLGLQAVRNRRDLRRVTENPLMTLPEGRYPNGFDSQQPPGTRLSYALIAQNAWTWGDLTLAPAIRWDRYRLTADGQAAVNRQAAGVPDAYEFTKTTPNVLLSWRPAGDDWILSYRWAKSFRPPLITDYFGMESASPCAGLLTADGRQIAPNGCGDLLRPAESRNRELTLAWAPGRWADGSVSSARLTLFQIDTTALVGASYLVVDGERIVQPYDERRRGLEFELAHEARRWFATLGVSRIYARRTNTLSGNASMFTAGIPGTTINISAGYRFFDERLEIGYRLRHTFDQVVLPNATALSPTTRYCGRVTDRGVVQAASTLQDLFATWRFNRTLTANLAINNLYDHNWCNNGDELGNVIGLPGPGRSVRLSLTAQF